MPTGDLPEAIQRTRWEVGARIRALRQERGWSQEHLAELLHVERRTVHRLEHGYRNLTLDRAVALATALDVPLRRLFKDDDGHDTSSSPEE